MKVSKKFQDRAIRTEYSYKLLKVLSMLLLISISILVGIAGYSLLLPVIFGWYKGYIETTSQVQLGSALLGLSTGMLVLLVPAIYSIFKSQE